ncbi:hypothetical protein I4U23_004455 [Adineta vaga]|nr:hypothetical protein I4U23_004455 [Adineta vaga]
MSATLCRHCSKNVCRRHFDEHADQIVQKLNPLADNINELNEKINSFTVKGYKQNIFDQLTQWRDEAIKQINDLYELKKQNLDLLLDDNEEVFAQQTIDHLETVNTLKNETASFINENDVTFEELNILKRRLRELEENVNKTHTRLVYCDIKPFSIDYDLILVHSTGNNYMHGGTLLCADYQMRLNDFYGNPKQKWELIYKAKKDGFRADDFHRCSDDKGPTMTIIQSKNGNYLFGGYTTIPWTSDNKYKKDSTAFLFTLRNPHNIRPTKFFVNRLGTNAAGHSKQIGGYFGGVVKDEVHFMDISISDNANKNIDSESSFPSRYIDTTGKGETLFAGEQNFMVEDVEVYKCLANEDESEGGNENEGEDEN